MATALELITRALITVNELPSGETADGNVADDGLDRLNSLFETWSLEDLLLYYEKTEQFNLVDGQQTYTIGPAGNFDTVRPVEILSAQLRDSNDLDIDLGVVSNDTYQRIIQKTTTAQWPRLLMYNPNYPLGEITLWPSPSSGMKLRLSHNLLLTGFTNLSDDVSLPPGYKELIVFGLAELFAIEAGRLDLLPIIQNKLEEAKANIKRKNQKEDLMGFDPRLFRRAGTYNPYIDQ